MPRRVLWFVALYVAGLAMVGAVAVLLRAAMRVTAP
jgi:hypothetical protein